MKITLKEFPLPWKTYASEIIEADRLYLFLFSDGTRIDKGEYLSSLEDGTELIVCTEEQIEKLSIYFKLKRNLSLKNISYPPDIDYFIWRLIAFRVVAFSKNNFDVMEAVISSANLVQSVFS